MGLPLGNQVSDEEQLIKKRRLRLYCSNYRTVLPSFLATCAVMTTLSLLSYPLLSVLAWVMIISIAYYLRIYHMRWYERNEDKITDYSYHQIRFNLAFLVTGCCWAFAIAYFGHGIVANLRDVIYILAGIISAFSIVTASASIVFFLLFNIPIASAVFYCNAKHADTSNLAFVEIGVFYLAAFALCLHLRNSFIQRVKLELNNESLSASENASRAELAQINSELEQRISERTEELTTLNQQLVQSQEKFKRAFRSIPDAVVICHFHDGKFIAVNDSVGPLTGYDLKDFEDRTIFDMGFWHDPAEQERFVSELQEHTLIRGFRAKIAIKSGELRDCELSAEIDEIDGVTCVICALRDITEKQQSQKALRESELQLGTIFDSAPNGIALGDANGCFLKVNRKYCEMLGYTEAELVGKNLSEVTVEEDVTTNIELLNGLKQGSISGYQMEKRYIHKSGKTFWINLSVSRVEDEHGDFKFAVAHAVDISSRKKAETEIIESESKFRAVFDESPISMSLLDQEGNILEVNKESCRMSGYSREELLGKNFTSVTHPDYVESSRELHEKLMQGQISSYRAERQLMTSDGTPKWIDLNVAVVNDKDGKPRFRIAHVQDIDQAKSQELMLKEQQEIYIQAERTGKLGYWEWDEIEDHMIHCSDGYASIFGGSVESNLRDCCDYESSLKAVHPDDRDRVRAMDREAVEKGQALQLSYRIITPDGEEKYVMEHSSMLKNDDGEVIKSFGITQDITDRINAELELEKRQKMFERSEALGGVGHWEWDEIEKKMTYCSQEYANILGLSVEETLASSASEEDDLSDVHPDDLEYVRRTEEECYQKALPFDMEYRIINAAGEVRYVHQLGDNVQNSEGKVIRSFGTLQDITEKKLAEIEREKRQLMFEQAETLGHIGHWEWDELEDKLVYASPEYAKIFHKSVKQILADSDSHEKDLSDIHPDDWQMVYDADYESIENAVGQNIVYRVIRNDGEIRYIHRISDVETNARGEVIKTYGTIQDITDKKKNELEFQKRHKMFEEAEKLGSLGHWEWNEVDDYLISCSEEYASIFGMDHEQIIRAASTYEGDLSLVHPDDVQLRRSMDYRSRTAGIPLELEYRIVRPDGEIRHVHQKGDVELDKNGKLVRSYGTLQDITERTGK